MENQAEFILRLAQAALADLDEEEATREKASKRYRHGGFHPTPHQSVDEEDVFNKLDLWRHKSKESPWRNDYLDCPETYEENSWQGKKFAQMFLVPRLVFDDLLEATQAYKGYKDTKIPLTAQKWVSFKEVQPDRPGEKQKGVGKGGATTTQPLALKLLATLMRLRGTKFAVIAELARISPGCLERFFYAWCAWFVETQYAQHVKAPETLEEIQCSMDKYDAMGQGGAICGFDAVHHEWFRCTSTWLYCGRVPNW